MKEEMNKKLGVFILRAQPLHSGHKDIIRKIMKICDKLLILIGSANSARTIRNPFTYHERRETIAQFIGHEYGTEQGKNIRVSPINDHKYSDLNWKAEVVYAIDSFKLFDESVTFFGHMKEGNDYLNWFPQYNFHNIDSEIDIDATGIRQDWFDNQRHRLDPMVLEDYDYFKKEAANFASYPYPEALNFCCGDSVLRCQDKVLMIMRKRAPGRGLWALPGGHKNNDETFLECALRELTEETGVDIPKKTLMESINEMRMFDAPNRGSGIPRSTLAVYMNVPLNEDGSYPTVTPLDDAMEAEWKTIYEILNVLDTFDDHRDIISILCNLMPITAANNPRFN